MPNDYIINSILEETIARFQEAKKIKETHQKEFDEVHEELANLFYILSENIIRAFGFRLIDKEDALQEGVMICLEKVGRFDPTYVGPNGNKTKAFNYMTTCVLNHFRQLHRGAKNQSDLQRKYFDHLLEKIDSMFVRQGQKGQSGGNSRLQYKKS